MNFVNVQQVQDIARSFPDQVDFADVPSRAIDFTPDGDISFPSADGLYFSMEEGALNQLCYRFNIPASYMRRCPSFLRSNNLSYWAENYDKPMLVRTQDDKIRAFLSKRYHVVDNHEMADILAQIVSPFPGVKITGFVGRDRMDLYVELVEGIAGGRYSEGFYLRNGEIGNSSIYIAPFFKRTSCNNSIVWADRAWSQAHVSMPPAVLKNNSTVAIETSVKLADDMIEAISRAQSERVDLLDMVNRLKRAHNLTDDVVGTITIGTEGQQTRMGLVNGITYAAHTIYGDVNPAARVTLEGLGARLLMEPKRVYAALPSATDIYE